MTFYKNVPQYLWHPSNDSFLIKESHFSFLISLVSRKHARIFFTSVNLSEKWAKVHKLAEAVAETEQTACDTGCLRHLNVHVKTSYQTKSHRRDRQQIPWRKKTFGGHSRTKLTRKVYPVSVQVFVTQCSGSSGLWTGDQPFYSLGVCYKHISSLDRTES